jgi:dTDP-4-dehydrorhamnose reductase
MKNKKIVILGATGKVGEAIIKLLEGSADHELLLLSSSDLDFSEHYQSDFISNVNYLKKKDLRTIIYDFEPDVIINTAAFTDVNGCEDDKHGAWKLNTELVENLVKASKINDYHLITFSTDYIFDGNDGPYSEDATPNPINYYGKTKLAAENIITTAQIRHTIIRTNVVYGFTSFGKHDFINWVAEHLKMNDDLEIIEGQWSNPTFSDDIARAVEKIIEKDRYGIYNIAGADWLNRYDLALKVADVFDYDKSLIKPIKSSDLVQKAKRPEKGGLITLKAETDLNMKFSSLQSGLSALKFKLESHKLRKVLYE